MDTLSPEMKELARTNHHKIVNGSESVGRAAIAKALNIDESYISKLKTEEQKINYVSIATMLAVMGLRVVPAAYLCVDQPKLQHRLEILTELAELGFNNLKAEGIKVFAVEDDP